MPKNVSTTQLTGLALEIQQALSSLKKDTENITDILNNIKLQCYTLDLYNGTKVAGSTRNNQVSYQDGKETKTYTMKHWATWKIEGQNELRSQCSSLESQVDEVESTISKLNLEAEDIQVIADTIDTYIQTMQEDLGENISTEALATSFGALSGKIAYDGASANNNNFISEDKILTEYWTDKTLRFEKQADGSYIMYQKDENGKEVAMGYTTALVAAKYMQTLNKTVKKENSNIVESQPVDEDDVKKIEEAKKRQEENNKSTQSSSEKTTSSKTTSETKTDYQEYKDIVTGSKETLQSALDNKEDIYISPAVASKLTSKAPTIFTDFYRYNEAKGLYYPVGHTMEQTLIPFADFGIKPEEIQMYINSMK